MERPTEKAFPTRDDIRKYAIACGVPTARNGELPESIYLFGEKLAGLTCLLQKQHGDHETFLRQRDTAYAVNCQLQQELGECRRRIRELETLEEQ